MEATSMLSHDLPPGFGFHPTDEELITHYLKQKVMSSSSPVVSLIADIDLYKFDPWELPEKALFGKGEWFFFSPRDRKYPNGDRPNRTAASGYWKATGSDKPILSSTTSGSQCLGVKKSLVFYKGKPSKGVKTDWVMDEYRLIDDVARSPKLKGSMRLDDWVLCRVHQKSNNTIQTRDYYNKHENSYSKSPPLVHQYLEQRNEVFEGSNHHLLGHLLMGSPEGGSSTTIDSCNCMYQSTCFQESPDLQLPDSKMISNEPQVPMVSSFQNMFESMKRTLSIGALDEHGSVVPPPNKRLASSSHDHWDNLSCTNIEELSPTVSTTSVTPSCFSSHYYLA